MRKVLGCLLIICAGLSIPIRGLRSAKARTELLTQIDQALQLMELELSSGYRDLTDILEFLSERTQKDTKVFFLSLVRSLDSLGEQSFRQLWETSVHHSLRTLNSDDREKIASLGAVLGRYDLQQQREEISRCRWELNSEAKRMNEAWPAKVKLSLGVGLGSAILLVLALI